MTTTTHRPTTGSSPTASTAPGAAAPSASAPRAVTAHVITSDAEALAVARELGEEFAREDAARDAARTLPREQVARLAASGLLGITVPRELGGAGVSARTLVEVVVEIARGDSSLGQIPQNHWFFLDVLAHVATPEQHAFFAREVLEGRHFGNALSERGTRSAFEYAVSFAPADPADPAGDWVLDGVKNYGTGTPFAPWIPVYANDPEGRLVAAWVEAADPGVTVVDDWTGMGQRTTGSGTVTFARVRVPADRIVPAWRIFEGVETFGAFGNVIHAAVDVGIAEAALRDGLELVRSVARPWTELGVESAAQDPLVISQVGELVVQVRAARALLREAGDALDAARADLTEETSAEASLAVAAARVRADEAALNAATEVFALVGTRSADEGLNLHRHWRNARTHTLHDPKRFKLRHLGNHALNGVLPPANGWI